MDAAGRLEPVGPVVARYVDRVLASLPGPKALLLDDDCRALLDAVATHSQLLAHEVLLVEPLSRAERPHVPHFGCVIVARPVAAAANDITAELAARRFREYHVIFTNTVDTDLLQLLANGDRHHRVRKVEEVFLDMVPVTDEACVIPLGSAGRPNAFCAAAGVAPGRIPSHISQWTNADIQRCAQGLVALMLASSRRPAIRYRAGSKVCSRLAEELGGRMRQVHQSFFDLRARGCVLLLLDRCDDPVTPLLAHWTYLSMAHEHLGVDAGKVNLLRPGETAVPPPPEGSGAAGAADPSDQTQILSAAHDNFFSAHRFSDWGALCTAVKDLIEAYKALHSISLETASLADIKQFVEKFPDAKSQSALVSRHATIVGRLGEAVAARRLVDVSTVQQELACNPEAPQDHAKAVLDLMADAAVPADELLRLAMLYELRYEGRASSAAPRIREALARDRGVDAGRLALLDRVAAYAGTASRVGMLFARRPGFFKGMARAIAGFRDQDVRNVLTQHTPHLRRVVLQTYNGALPEADYPFASAPGGATATTPFREMIVFMAGGATYAEAQLCRDVCAGAVANDREIAAEAQALGAPVPEAAADEDEGHGYGMGAAANVGKSIVSGVARLVTTSAAGGAETEAPAAPAAGDEEEDMRPVDCRVTLACNGMLTGATFLDGIPR